MAPTIRKRIEDVILYISTHRDKAEELRGLAVEAIYDVQGSAAWERFMTNFARELPDGPVDPVHLARLTGVNDTPCNPAYPYHRSARAYLIANATCGTPTYNNYLLGIADHFDVTLPIPPPDETTPDETALEDE
jgi:hypothetical protein